MIFYYYYFDIGKKWGRGKWVQNVNHKYKIIQNISSPLKYHLNTIFIVWTKLRYSTLDDVP